MRRWLLVWLSVLLLLPALPASAASADPATAIAQANAAFSWRLYDALRAGEPGANIVFSPYSVSQALAIAYLGARGETAAQLAEACGFPSDGAELAAAFGAMNADLVARGNAAAEPAQDQTERWLRIANALWGEQTYPFSPDFMAQLAAAYGAGLQTTSFKGDPEAARRAINAWVAEQTGGRITDIVPSGAVDSNTLLVLANAIHFASQWQIPFSPNATEDGLFHRLDGATVTSSFMNRHDHFAYARGEGYQVVELPYGAGASRPSDFVFTAIVPDEGNFAEAERSLVNGGLDAALGGLVSTEIELALPKFSFTFGAELGPALTAMGITDVFDPGTADFSGMVSGQAASPLVLGAVLHKAFIAVDERGTEASAATVELIPGAAPPDGPPPEVRLDRPFLFAIRDAKTGTVLFLGRVMDPSV